MDNIREMESEEGREWRVSGPQGGVGGHILVMLLASILSTAGEPGVQICCWRDPLNKQPALHPTSGPHLHPISTNKHNAHLANRRWWEERLTGSAQSGGSDSTTMLWSKVERNQPEGVRTSFSWSQIYFILDKYSVSVPMSQFSN